MTIYSLRRSLWLPRALPEVFAFFECPENLALLTPPDLSFKILTPSPIVMRAGALIDYSVRPFGVPCRWRTLIESYDPPHGFVDSQVRGPYALWSHAHRFASEGEGTRMLDEIRYAPPLGCVGRLAQPFIARELARIFDFRAAAVSRRFGASQEAE